VTRACLWGELQTAAHAAEVAKVEAQVEELQARVLFAEASLANAQQAAAAARLRLNLVNLGNAPPALVKQRSRLRRLSSAATEDVASAAADVVARLHKSVVATRRPGLPDSVSSTARVDHARIDHAPHGPAAYTGLVQRLLSSTTSSTPAPTRRVAASRSARASRRSQSSRHITSRPMPAALRPLGRRDHSTAGGRRGASKPKQRRGSWPLRLKEYGEVQTTLDDILAAARVREASCWVCARTHRHCCGATCGWR